MSKSVGPLIKVAIPLAENVLALLGITAATSAIDAGIQKKTNGSGTITLIIWRKLFKLLKILIFYWKDSLKRLKIKQKNKKEDF